MGYNVLEYGRCVLAPDICPIDRIFGAYARVLYCILHSGRLTISFGLCAKLCDTSRYPILRRRGLFGIYQHCWG